MVTARVSTQPASRVPQFLPEVPWAQEADESWWLAPSRSRGRMCDGPSNSPSGRSETRQTACLCSRPEREHDVFANVATPRAMERPAHRQIPTSEHLGLCVRGESIWRLFVQMASRTRRIARSSSGGGSAPPLPRVLASSFMRQGAPSSTRVRPVYRVNGQVAVPTGGQLKVPTLR